MSSKKISSLVHTLHRCGMMLSELSSLPILFFYADGIKWTLSGILLMSAIYTYSINQLSNDQEAVVRADRFAHAKRLQTAQLARIERDERQKRVFESKPFRFLDLPPEIGIIVLSHCADWPTTFQSLVLVSEHIQQLTFYACLPRMPIRLISHEQVNSFNQLLHSHPELTKLIKHMWMTPVKRELLPTAITVVQKCKNLRSLATNYHIIQESITLRGTRLSHLYCKDLTLLSLRSEAWTTLLTTPNGSAFFRQLTHLRLIGDRVPQDSLLPNLTHFSYGNDMSECNPCVGIAMLDDKHVYPKLHTVILTKSRTSAGGLRISRAAAKTRVFIFELPQKRTELEMWCDNTSRGDMWELCA